MKTIDIVKNLLNKINYSYPILSINSIDAENHIISLENTLYLNYLSTVTINSNTFSVTDVNDNFITINGTSSFELNDLVVIEPLAFHHGTFLDVNNELLSNTRSTEKYPIAFLIETPLTERWNKNTYFDLEIDIILCLLNESYISINQSYWTVTDHYKYCIEPMKLVAKEIESILDRDYNQTQITIKNMKDFGIYTQKGQEKMLLPKRLSGIEMRFTLFVNNKYC